MYKMQRGTPTIGFPHAMDRKTRKTRNPEIIMSASSRSIYSQIRENQVIK